jgi:cytidylate kinase
VRVSKPSYVIVSGPPGSGKSTLAKPLAARIGLPLFSKDVVKEALMRSLDVADVDESQRLGRAAIKVIIALAHENGSGVLECNWRASVATAPLQALSGAIVEVFCACDVATCRDRFQQRGLTRDARHFDEARFADASLWDGEVRSPVAGGWEVISVDTTTPVDVERLCVAIMERSAHA